MASSVRASDSLLGMPLIDVVGTPNGWHDWKARYTPQATGSTHRVNVDSYAVAANMAVEEVGVCLLYDELVRGSRLELFLLAPLDAPIDCDAGYYLCARVGKPLSASALAFSRWVDAELA